PLHVPIDDLGHVGAPACATEGRAFPHPARDELERPRRDLFARARHPDDDAFAPALVAALERLAHDLDVADAFEAVIGTAAGELDEVRDEIARHLLRIDEVGHPELFGELAPRRVDVDADDLGRADHARALDHVEPDAAEAEHDD